MASSAITLLHDVLLNVVKETDRGEWKVLVVDEASRALIDNVVEEDDILQENITKIEQLENKRSSNASLDAIYLVSPEPYVVECIVADIERRKYRRSFLVFTSILPPPLRERIDRCRGAREQIAQLRILNVDFFPQESNLILFRQPWSFPILFHPECNQLVQRHMQELTQKIVSACVSLGEYPAIRFFRPQAPQHEAAVLCGHLARFVQEGLDQYAQANRDFPPPSPRPRGTLVITDRAMDLFSPLIHEFTYQAMVNELLPLDHRDNAKVYYRTIVAQGTPNEEEKSFELGEKDRIWVENRHMHMKDLLEKLVNDFKRFRAENPQFADDDSNPATLNSIKDMIAGLPQFQQGKELYTTHLNMAQECMNIFSRNKLPEIASVEQSMATGLDEDFKKPTKVTDQLVRLLDDENVAPPDRLRLVLQYILYRDGIFPQDLQKLLAHAQLPGYETEPAKNLDLLGGRAFRAIKDQKLPSQPLFPRKPVQPQDEEEMSLTRFEPSVKYLLEDLFRGTLDPLLFPYTKPLADPDADLKVQIGQQQTSLRSAKPTWARTRPTAAEPRQRVILFMAGGATYSESRACYETSRAFNKDVYLATTHMLTPKLFVRQLGELSGDRRNLGIPYDRPPRQAPRHIIEPDDQGPAPPVKGPQPPTAAMGNMKIGPNGQQVNGGRVIQGGLPGSVRPAGERRQPQMAPQPSQSRTAPPAAAQAAALAAVDPARPPEKEQKDKKHRKFFKF